MSRYIMGSRYFFMSYPDFKPHDLDTIELVPSASFKTVRVLRGQGKDYFQFIKKTKEEMIQDALESPLPMVVGKFLIPEVCRELGITIDDLPRFQPLIDALDLKHKYEEIIYQAYLTNNSFTLTQKQRDAAYKSYCEARIGGAENG